MNDVTDEQLAEWEAISQRNQDLGVPSARDKRILSLVRAFRDERDEADSLRERLAVVEGEAERLRHLPYLSGRSWVEGSIHDAVKAERDSLRERLAAVEAAIRAEIASWRHEVVEDCWYTCPAATDERDGGHCCNDNAGTTCYCGLESRRARILAALAAPTGQEAEHGN